MDLKGGLNLIVSLNNMEFLGSNGPLGGSEGADLIHTPEMMGGGEGGRGEGGRDGLVTPSDRDFSQCGGGGGGF